MIRFHCSACNNRIRVPSSYAGRKVKCPHCHKAVEVPSADPHTDEPPPPAAAPRPHEEPSADDLDALAAAGEHAHTATPQYPPPPSETDPTAFDNEDESYVHAAPPPPPAAASGAWPTPATPVRETRAPSYSFLAMVGWMYTILGGLAVFGGIIAFIFGLAGSFAGAGPQMGMGSIVVGIGLAFYFALIAFFFIGLGQLFFAFRDLCRNSWKLNDISAALRQMAAQPRY